MIGIKIAFSCTCQPNMKLVSPQITKHLKKLAGCLLSENNLVIAGTVNIIVSNIVVKGVTFGRIPCVMSCTSPPVIEAVAFFSNVVVLKRETKTINRIKQVSCSF